MTNQCSRFHSIPGPLQPSIFCQLKELSCPTKAAVQFSSSHFCFRDSSHSLAGPSCCRKLKIRQENIGFTQMERHFLDFKTGYKEPQEGEMERRINSISQGEARKQPGDEIRDDPNFQNLILQENIIRDKYNLGV